MNTVAAFFLGAGATMLLLTWLAWRHNRKALISVNEEGFWEFPMDTLPQMLAIPAERRERFLAELPAMLRRTWEMHDKYPIRTLPGCTWVDDGLGEFRPQIINKPENAAGSDFDARPLGDA